MICFPCSSFNDLKVPLNWIKLTNPTNVNSLSFALVAAQLMRTSWRRTGGVKTFFFNPEKPPNVLFVRHLCSI